MTQTHQPIAHAAKEAGGQWREPHDLAAHLHGVAALAAEFAREFDAAAADKSTEKPDASAAWARLAGLWHDLGKYRPRFQKYIRQASGFGFDENAHIEGKAGKAPHSTAGALLATQRFGKPGRVLAYLIAGHHAGLDDWHGGLRERLEETKSQEELAEALAAQPPDEVLDAGAFAPHLRAIPGGAAGFALWVRMLFSCLVDADFLDTERYMNPAQFDLRGARGRWPTLAELTPRFEAHMATLASDNSSVNRWRADILQQCRAKAEDAPGLFSLTVPTGGGKTLSSMAFALAHAQAHGKRRIIYVIPYTSIIEQTADVFRVIFGEAVIEHHSNAEAAPGQENSQSRLACENWDAPVIVTTTVQFFESLFAARTSRCRKLHNIANSIVVLDEAQLLPPEFLQPVLDVLNLLGQHYGVSVVLSTATQPALCTRSYFDARQNVRGLDAVREIIADPDALYQALERVHVELPSDWQTPTTWEALAAELAQYDSALTIVNRRQDAQELWQHLRQTKPGALHLSALMCGAHRSAVIRDIRQRLKDEVPTQVVSTQLVEAGVDVDFPVVYRALAGLDSIAQAAGRCNREGKLRNREGEPMRGLVKVFLAPQPAPEGLLKKGEEACRSVLHGFTGKPLRRDLFARYFEHWYHACDLDRHQISADLTVDKQELAVKFRTAAEKFRLIDDEDHVPVIVLYPGVDAQGKGVVQWLDTLKKDGPERWLMRKLQRYTVNIPRRHAATLLHQGDIEERLPGLHVQVSDWLYDNDTGLRLDGKPVQSKECVV